METSLHRELKALYSNDESEREVTVNGYRIDAVSGGRLIEIQCGSLGAIRGKVTALVQEFDVLVVKPLAARTYIVNYSRRGAAAKSSRFSPARQTVYHLFDDLVHFTNVFPHQRLALEVVLTEQEEHRLLTGSRRWRRKGYRVQDRKLRAVGHRLRLRTARDLLTLLPYDLSERTFTTADLASKAEIPRWLAQKMAYCLRKTGAVDTVGRQRNMLIYQPHGLQQKRVA